MELKHCFTFGVLGIKNFLGLPIFIDDAFPGAALVLIDVLTLPFGL